MKKISFLVVFLVLLWGCNNHVDELEKANADLQTSNHQLTQDLADRDTYVDNVTQSINDVYNSLETVQAKERSLLKETNELESGKKPTREELRTKLIDKITVINSTLRDNQKTVNDL